ncbi:hypothetical protein J23TS9_41520 [Paenibacillus sp. J23TS9]|uniref:carbohydrate-binding domain-containing protein n=1 Tax=Paenibacillus sp. J23TS9 TaxID=2807193 RepID=UPI001B0BEB82|nr:carbohydrate-binding domain-containing protein [Paenibacillus sp. J23TS9]GIP29022.1 hypothetical protein J23TS9_41520 [Paenibacillus sp. J23TS9]
MKQSYKTKFAAILILTAMLASGCTTNAASSTTSGDSTAVETDTAAVDASTANAQLASLKIKDLVEYDTDDTTVDWKEGDATTITLSGTSATVSGEGAQASGGDVKISSAGTYAISGKLTSGSIVVEAGKDDIVHLVLNGAQIINSSGPAVQVKKAGKTVLTLNKGTNNSLSDGKTYADTSEDAPTAALFSQDDLTINGAGKLTVQGNHKDGITSKDDLKIVSGTLDINAADDGIIGRDLAAIKTGVIHVNAGGDGFKTTYDGDKDKGYLVIEDGMFNIDAGSDGFQASTTMLIDGGTFDMVTGGGSANAEPHQEEQPPQRPDFGSQTGTGAQSGPTSTQAQDAKSQNTKTNSEAQSQTETQKTEQKQMAATDTNATAQADTENSEETETGSAKGLKADAGISISDGQFKIDSADDAVHTNGSIRIVGGQFSLATGDDGIHADTSIAISGGTIDITKSYEGIESADIAISGGEIQVVASDDGVNASEGGGSAEGPGGMFGGEPPAGTPGQVPPEDQAQTNGSQTQSNQTQSQTDQAQSGDQSGEQGQAGAQQPPTGGQGMPGGPGGSGNAKLTISGGHLTVDAAGDGLDSNGSIVMTGGTVLVNGPTMNGNGALDYDGTFEQSGGLLVAAGSSGMAQTPSESSSQRSMMMTFPSTLKAGTLVTLADSKGTPILSFAPAKSIQSIVISTPDLKAGETYILYSGGTSTGTPKDGLYEKGKLTGGTKIVSFKLGDTVTYVNESGVTTGGGGFGGGRGQGGPGGGQRKGESAGNGASGQSGTTSQNGGTSGTDSTQTSEKDSSV